MSWNLLRRAQPVSVRLLVNFEYVSLDYSPMEPLTRTRVPSFTSYTLILVSMPVTHRRGRPVSGSLAQVQAQESASGYVAGQNREEAGCTGIKPPQDSY